MSKKLFFETVRYLNYLYENGLLDEKEIRNLASYSLELGESGKAENKNKKMNFRGPDDETLRIIHDVLAEGSSGSYSLP